MSKKAKIALIIIILIAVGAFLFIKNRNKGQVEYTLEKVNNYNYFILKQDNKYGVMGANGDTIITPVYACMLVMPDSIIMCSVSLA